VFDPNQTQYKKHIFVHTNFMIKQIIVFIKQSIFISIENPRVGGSIPPLGTIFQKDINNLNSTN